MVEVNQAAMVIPTLARGGKRAKSRKSPAPYGGSASAPRQPEVAETQIRLVQRDGVHTSREARGEAVLGGCCDRHDLHVNPTSLAMDFMNSTTLPVLTLAGSPMHAALLSWPCSSQTFVHGRPVVASVVSSVLRSSSIRVPILKKTKEELHLTY